MKGSGCLYLAFGRPYLIQALNSARSLRKQSPSIPVCIITNTLHEAPPAFTKWGSSMDSWVFLEDPDDRNRLVKTDLFRFTPFERTLYLDC